jgi:catechol 2,3-dioxygenase-like lactoylglutathione lyase family enzyme
MKLGRLNHVAIAVPNLEKATAIYRDTLGGSVTEPQALPEHGVTVVFVDLGNTKVELLEPLGECSPIGAFLEKNPSGAFWATANRRRAPTASPCCSCIPRISAERWSNWNRHELGFTRRHLFRDVVAGSVRHPALRREDAG